MNDEDYYPGIPDDCWLWDGYIGECKRWHRPPDPQWWEYANVWSILAVVGGITLLFVICVVVGTQLTKWLDRRG